MVVANAHVLFKSISASGNMCIGLSLLSSIALTLSILGNSRCDLLRVTGSRRISLLPFEAISFGLWCFESVDGGSYDLRNLSIGRRFDTARALGVTTLCVGGMTVIFYLVAGCRRFPPHTFKIAGALCILNALFEGLVFLVFKSIVCIGGCRLGKGGKFAVSAVVMWFLTGIISYGVGNEAEESEGNNQENNNNSNNDRDDDAKPAET